MDTEGLPKIDWDDIWRKAAQSGANIRRKEASERFAKAMKKRGYTQPRTQSTYGWRLRERPHSVIRAEYINPANPNADWDYAPVGEPTTVRFMPRTNVSATEEILVWARSEKDKSSRRRILQGFTFTRMCDSAKCGKTTCARCFAIEYAPVGRNEILVFERIALTTKIRVSDTGGVSPVGHRPLGPPDPSPEDKALYSLTSTQREYKKGADTKWR